MNQTGLGLVQFLAERFIPLEIDVQIRVAAVNLRKKNTQEWALC